MSNMELLAPGGGEAALRAAVQSGADAVYIGCPKFSARRGADNFSVESIKKQAAYCHLYGVDLHAAVNILIKENELSEIKGYVYDLCDAGVDALIIQDLGAAEYIHRLIPEMPLHASTQMTVTSLEGVRYLEEKGFSRVVLARELSKSEIEYICQNAKAGIEVFVHGAICMCYSGQCLMSSILGGRSGNRGCCAQPCRLPYSICRNGKKQAEGYMLSPKDMSLINELSVLENIGVSSLKIEGRLKRAEYVSAVVGIYRKYLDNPSRVTDSDMRELLDAFSRSGFTDGYFTEKLGKNMMSHKTPGNITENKFSDRAKRRAAEGANVRKIPIDISAYISDGSPVMINISDNENNYAAAEGTILAEQAVNRPLETKRIKEQLLKLGQTPFEARSVSISADEGITVPVKELNAVRREACEELIRLREKRPLRRKHNAEPVHKSRVKTAEVRLTAEVMNIEQAKAVVKSGIETVYAPNAIATEVEKLGAKHVIACMSDIFDGEKPTVGDVCVQSGAAVRFYEKYGMYGGMRLNVFNSQTAEAFNNLKSVTLSAELNLREISELLENTDAAAEVIGYGRLPLMIMKNCPVKAAGHCAGGKSDHVLHDRKNEEFPVICTKGCRAVLLNSKPIYTADKLSDLIRMGINSIRLVFTVEDAKTCREIVNEYISAANGQAAKKMPENQFTRGHFYRGVL